MSKIDSDVSVLWVTVVRYKTKNGFRHYEIGDKVFKSENEAMRYAGQLCTDTIYKIPKIDKGSVEIGAKALELAQLENS